MCLIKGGDKEIRIFVILFLLTQCVDHTDATHVEFKEGVIDRLPSFMVHEEVVDHGSQLR